MNLINEEVRALSLKHPYAHLMLPPHNKIETRTWDTKYRGLVLICCTKKPYTYKDIVDISGLRQHDRITRALRSLREYHYGMAIAVARLVDSRPMIPTDADLCFVEYKPHLYCHIYDEVRLIHPFPFKGTQGWQILSEEVKRKIEYL